MSKRYLRAAAASITAFSTSLLLGALLAVLLGTPWNKILMPGLVTSTFVGLYCLRAVLSGNESGSRSKGSWLF